MKEVDSFRLKRQRGGVSERSKEEELAVERIRDFLQIEKMKLREENERQREFRLKR